MFTRRLAFLQRGFGEVLYASQNMRTNGTFVWPNMAFSSAARFSTNPALYVEKPIVAESEVVAGAEKVPGAATTTTEKGSAASKAHRDLQARILPSSMTKQALVMMGMYKSTSEVPTEISQHEYTRARTWIRIRFAALTMIATLLSCYIVVVEGKKNVAEARVIENLRYQQEIDEKYDAAHGK